MGARNCVCNYDEEGKIVSLCDAHTECMRAVEKPIRKELDSIRDQSNRYRDVVTQLREEKELVNTYNYAVCSLVAYDLKRLFELIVTPVDDSSVERLRRFAEKGETP